ncbi:hypothetical protein POM88_007560 [Heracleum sosnowskyi]|uniref:Uncharacterized protein n=1 Tax=Heracleum sosnowskyi TaxID=360622 RepID=A0AAD8N6C2_9APIA|nr:hypothetical protein POM88_007560 [Heracleum sosnowskyi]
MSSPPLRLEIKRKLVQRSERVKSVDLHPTEPWILASLYSGTVCIWNYQSQTMSKSFEIWNLGSPDPNFTLDAHLKGVNCVDYFTGGDKPYLITGSDDHTAKFQLSISLGLEQIIHIIGKKNKSALYEVLVKIKSELMLLGFISLLLTVLKGTISEICIPKAIGNLCLPCDKDFEEEHENDFDGDDGHKKLLSFTNMTITSHHRSLAAAAYVDKCVAKA